ncbi:MAG: AAA family ATPase [Pseudomonadota bacterium]
MLISFSARNFRSLRDCPEHSFVASSDSTLRDTHCIPTELRAAPWLTRSALVYGVNASGKSNLIFALVVMANLVKQSTALKDTDFAKAYTPFRLDRSSEREPTEFEINLLIDGIRYEYGFAYDGQRIRAEWLTVYRTPKGQRWFERRWDEQRDVETWAPFSAHFTGPR